MRKFEAANERIEAKQNRASAHAQPSRAQTLDASAIDARLNDANPGKQALVDVEKDRRSDETPIPQWKPTLRVDAFLGEWLSPAYFEFITAPPNSTMMVAGAKLDLMRRGSPLQGAREAGPPPQTPESHWQDGLVKRSGRKVSFQLDGLADSLPKVDRTDNDGTDRKDYGLPSTSPRSRHHSISNGYAPPVPTYAIQANKAIPAGYVAHARDACIRLDFQWDSMRDPQDWGDGGEYGEGWGSMHRRMRRGLMEMISWYRKESPYYDPQATDDANDKSIATEDDGDVVLVIVTHGAPCNALIGALTNQPVLLDVGMGSLTMAVHKGKATTSPSPVRRRSSVAAARRRPSVDCSQADEYEMRYTASSEHLRAGADPLKIPQLQSSYLSAIPEGRCGGSSASSDGSLTPAELENPSARNAALGSMRRSRATTMGSGHRNDSADSTSSNSGLWANRSATLVEPSETLPSREGSFNSDDDGTLANTSEVREVSNPPPTASVTRLPDRAMTQNQGGGGLWGSGGAKKPPVRRWTVVESK